MKAVAIFVAFLGVVLFINSPAETVERTADSLGVSPVIAIGAIALGGLLFLMSGSRTTKGR